MSEKIVADTSKERLITMAVPPAMNATARIAGFPIAEFGLIMMFVLLGTQFNLLLGVAILVLVQILGKVRKHKPVNWLTFLPYLWFKIRYAYLLPPGRKTFLP